MATIDTTYYYLIQSTFFPNKCLTVVNGNEVRVAPSPTTLAQYWTECWAFKSTGGTGYTLTNMSSGFPNTLGVVYDPGQSDDGMLAYGFSGLSWQWQVIPLASVTGTVVNMSTNGQYGWGPMSSWWLNFTLSGSFANCVNVLKNNNFSLQKYWTLTKTAIKV
jgi:hypothetical protein